MRALPWTGKQSLVSNAALAQYATPTYQPLTRSSPPLTNPSLSHTPLPRPYHALTTPLPTPHQPLSTFLPSYRHLTAPLPPPYHLLTTPPRYGNRILEGGNGLKPNTPAELNVELKNQHPEGGAEPRAEWGAGGVEGPGVYRLGYGVRVQGTFLLSIKLMGQDVLERLVTISAEAVEGDNEERWAEDFSLARAQEAQRLLEEQAARLLEEARHIHI